jgi:glycosyltransferase involved in cell wall biosynthesis
MKILFISRAYPPVVGGIENQNYELSIWLPKHADVKTLANRKGKKFLPFFLPYALIKALFLMPRYDVLLLGDGVLGIVGWAVKRCFSKKTVVSVVHGLDLTFKSSFYQRFWVHGFIPALDGLIAVGNETIRQGVARGIPEVKFAFVPNGVDTEKHFAPHERKELEDILGLSLADKHVLLTSGRLAKRKGVAWFVRNVMPRLPENILYVVAGDGADRENIERARGEAGMIDRVKMLGYVSDEVREILFNTCDLFIQPNIKVEGDMEGFGISVIEAASCELPVIASSLEGLKDAIKEGENGFLVKTEDTAGFVSNIAELLRDQSRLQAFKKQVRRYVIDHYAWESISQLYISTLEKIAKI